VSRKPGAVQVGAPLAICAAAAAAWESSAVADEEEIDRVPAVMFET